MWGWTWYGTVAMRLRLSIFYISHALFHFAPSLYLFIYSSPGQEAGNVPYVEENGFGTYSGDPTVITETVSSWLETPDKLQQMQKAALEAARPAATLDIARDIAEYLFERKGVSGP